MTFPMKRFLTILITLLITVIFLPYKANSQNLNKELKKEYKVKMKEYSKGGWELFGSSRSFEVTLMKHLDKLNSNDNIKEIFGSASRVSSKSVGHQVTINDACRTYAQNAGSHVKGRVVSDLGADGEDSRNEFEHFYGAYERLVEKEIKGELVESYTICREIGKDDNGKPIFEMMTYFYVDEDAATQARIRAFENAAKESAAAQKYAENVSNFIKEGFPIEQ